MYIQPDTKIYILKDCPLDPSYDHTLFWKDETSQQNYFTSIAKYKLTEQTYQRVQKGSMRVQIKAENLYDCNYLMFQNSAFGTKWFYAFIKGVEYVNNISSEITFEIDVMQTWFFDYQLGQCFVEREHSATDNVGENTVPETLEQGPYVVNDSDWIEPSNFTSHRVMVLSTFDQTIPDFPDIAGGFYGNVYAGVQVQFYENANDVNTLLIAVTEKNKISGIVGIYMCPFNEITSRQEHITITKNYSSINGYVPKNSKLLSYPYNVLHIYNGEASGDFKYELFGTSKCTFILRYRSIPEPMIILAPEQYAGEAGTDTESKLVTSRFPQCVYNNDVYLAYLAQYQARLPIEKLNAFLNVGSGMAGLISSAATGNISGAVNSAFGTINAVTGIAAIEARKSDISTLPPQINGNSTPNADWEMDSKRFVYKKLTIKAEYAKIIDDYFTMFGYATHRVKVPNRNTRPHWNYVKTVGCVLEGSVPADDVVKICSLYNNGITFWHNPNEIGDYSLDNAPGVG